MDDIEKIKEYALKHYKKHFKKKKTRTEHSMRGKILKSYYIDLPVLVSIKNTHIEIKNNEDASPIILNKNILQ